MRVMDWNIEHMNSWWTGGTSPVLRASFGGNNFSPAVTNVPALAARVAAVIQAVDPDVVAIQEGPGLPEAQDFFQNIVGGPPWTILRGAGGVQALLVAARTDRDVSAMVVGQAVAGGVDLASDLRADTDADLDVEDVAFARRPQVVSLTAHGRSIRFLNNHLKSKFVNNGESRWNAGGEQRLGFIAEALQARRRISAEAYRIRSFLDAAFAADEKELVIVAGDLNDGAGADFFEENYLTHSVVDRVFGSVFHRGRQLTHALFHGGSQDFTAEFFDFVVGARRELVLDHIGFSPGMAEWTWSGRVAVAEYDAQVVPDADADAQGLATRDRHPSDHRPVVLDIAPN